MLFNDQLVVLLSDGTLSVSTFDEANKMFKGEKLSVNVITYPQQTNSHINPDATPRIEMQATDELLLVAANDRILNLYTKEFTLHK